MQQSASADRRGILICIVAMAAFACMDAMTTFVVRDYAPAQIMMIRYWAFCLCALAFVQRTVGIRAAFASARPGLQFVRSMLLAVETIVMAMALGLLGLAETHALFAVFPLIATGLAVLFLGEPIGWRRGIALMAGFAGALIIIRPGIGVFHPAALLPLAAATIFAGYHIVTRLVSHHDNFHTSFAFMAMIGALLLTPLGLAQWRAPSAEGWMYLSAMAVLGVFGHALLVKGLEYTPATVLQPFNYFLLAWATVIGVTVLGEPVDWLNIAGAAVIVCAGLFTMFREREVGPDDDPPVGDLPPVDDSAAPE